MDFRFRYNIGFLLNVSILGQSCAGRAGSFGKAGVRNVRPTVQTTTQLIFLRLLERHILLAYWTHNCTETSSYFYEMFAQLVWEIGR